MTHTYYIKGMTCNSCKASVEQALQQVNGVEEAKVNFDASEATIKMLKPISTETLQDALAEKYTISEQE